MNATQSKQLLKAARQALALLDPSWSVAGELKGAIAAAAAPVAIKRGSKIPRDSWAGATPHPLGCFAPDGILWRLADELRRGVKWKDNIAGCANTGLSKEQRFAAYRETLDTCACGHRSDRHQADELENLLKCRDCDCDHFHYAHRDDSAIAA